WNCPSWRRSPRSPRTGGRSWTRSCACFPRSTARVAVLVTSGQVDTAAPAGAPMKGGGQGMFLKKFKWAGVPGGVGAGPGGGGLAYQGGHSTARAQAPRRPVSELEKLRRENELLKLNLEVVLERVRSQDAEIRSLKAQAQPTAASSRCTATPTRASGK